MSKQKLKEALKVLSGDYQNLDLSSLSGKQLFFVFDIENDICLYISPRIKNITGNLDSWYMAHQSAHFVKRILHPADFYSFYMNSIITRVNRSQVCNSVEQSLVYDTRSFSMRIAHNKGNWIQIKGKLLRIFRGQSSRPELLIASFVQECQADINERFDSESLTRREMEILELISNGYSSRVIAAQLNICEETVISHRKHLLRKFHVKNTAALIKRAMQHKHIN